MAHRAGHTVYHQVSHAPNGRQSVGVVSNSAWTTADTTDGVSFVSASISVPAGAWLVVGVANTGATSQDPSSVVTTTGALALSLQGAAFTVGTTNNCRLSVYARFFPVAYTGTLTVTFGATATACCIAPVALTGGPQTGAIVQVAAGATAASGTAIAANALAAFEHVNNLCVAFCVTRSPTITAGTNFTDRGQAAVGSPNLRLEVQTAVNDNTADATAGASSEWGAIALEFKAA